VGIISAPLGMFRDVVRIRLAAGRRVSRALKAESPD